MSRIETFVSGQWAVDVDMDALIPMLAVDLGVSLSHVFDPLAAASLVMDYALEHDCTLDQAIEAVNARADGSPGWANVRWATEEEKARVA